MLIIFDFDNTLERFTPAERVVEGHILGALATKYRLPQAQLAEAFSNIKRTYVNARAKPQDYDRVVWLRDLFHFFHLPEPPETWSQVYWKRILAEVTLFPGCKAMLEQMSDEHTICILSDSDGHLDVKRQRIAALGLNPYIDTLFTSDAVGHNKPHPRAFLQILDHYHVAVEDCVMVGDNPPVDLRTAHELGMHTIWARQGAPSELRNEHFAYVDAVIDSLEELPAVLQSIGQPARREPHHPR